MPPSSSFKTRIYVTIGIAAIIAISFLTPDVILLRIVYSAAAFLAYIEISSMTYGLEAKRPGVWCTAYALSVVIYGGSLVGFWSFPPKTLLLLVVTTYGSDAAGWLIGNLIGGKLIKSRPFPKTSPKKTWEGAIASVFVIAPFTIAVNLLWPDEDPTFTIINWALVGGGILAITGDYLASRLKRCCNVKDSGELLARSRFFAPIESLLGGHDGHGGYLDRTDSLAFTTCIACIARLILS